MCDLRQKVALQTLAAWDSNKAEPTPISGVAHRESLTEKPRGIFNRGRIMADKTTLISRLREITHEKGNEISEVEAQARIGDRFYAEAFGYGTEIRAEEQQRLSEIADAWLDSN